MAKDFKRITNPAMQFITAEEETPAADIAGNTQHTQNAQNTQNTQPKAKSGDLKGKRFNLLFYSTDTLEALKVLAKIENAESVNALINKILTSYTEENANKIKQYNDLFSE